MAKRTIGDQEGACARLRDRLANESWFGDVQIDGKSNLLIVLPKAGHQMPERLGFLADEKWEGFPVELRPLGARRLPPLPGT